MIIIGTQDGEVVWSGACGYVYVSFRAILLSFTGSHKDAITIGRYESEGRANEVVKEFSEKLNTRLGYNCDIAADNVFYSMPKE